MQSTSYSSELILLDTGIVKNVLKKSQFGFWDSFVTQHLFAGHKIKLFGSGLMGFEYLGFRIVDVDPYRSCTSTKKLIDDLLINGSEYDLPLKSVFEIIKTWIGKKCTLERMKKQYSQQCSHLTGETLGVYEILVGKHIEDQNSWSDMIQDLSMDRLQSIPFSEAVADKATLQMIDVKFLLAVCDSFLKRDAMVSHARFCDGFFRRAGRKIGKEFQANFTEQGEALDTEIADRVIRGQFIDNENPRRVFVFTTERLTKWKDRVGHHLEVLKYIYPAIEDRIAQDHLLAPGIIYKVNCHTGAIEGKFDVRSLDFGKWKLL